jgi:hypothetical protein
LRRSLAEIDQNGSLAGRLHDVAYRIAVRARAQAPPSAVTALALSRDGTMLASGDKGGAVLLWKLDGKK